MPVTARGNKSIIMPTDYFSMWAEAAPLPDKTSFELQNLCIPTKKLHRSHHINTVYCRLCVEWDAQKFLSQIKDVNLSRQLLKQGLDWDWTGTGLEMDWSILANTVDPH